MPTLPQFLSQAFNGIALGSLLALIASGLSIILGTLGVLNFAHGAMFMLGAYAGFVVLGHWDSFAAALALGALVLLLVRLGDRARLDPVLLPAAAGGSDPGHVRPRHHDGRGRALRVRPA